LYVFLTYWKNDIEDTSLLVRVVGPRGHRSAYRRTLNRDGACDAAVLRAHDEGKLLKKDACPNLRALFFRFNQLVFRKMLYASAAANRLLLRGDASFLFAIDGFLLRDLWLIHRKYDNPYELFHAIRFTLRKYTSPEERYKILPFVAASVTEGIRKTHSKKRITSLEVEHRMIRAAMEVIKVTSSAEEAKRLIDKCSEMLDVHPDDRSLVAELERRQAARESK
tara:strand:+ start:2336 stop:3004 length:669 start_codon:yes stop_codon:yes gene_type:complete